MLVPRNAISRDGCIPCFIPKIPVYGTLVLEFDSSVLGVKSVL